VSRRHFPPCKEIAVAAVIMAAFALDTILTAEMFGHVTVDKIAYSAPAVNLVISGTFTSSAWYSQTKDKFWMSNTPLHQFLLARWLRLFGFSIQSISGFSAFMICAAGFVLWLFLRRSELVTIPALGAMFLLRYATGYGMSLWMRLGRPDLAV